MITLHFRASTDKTIDQITKIINNYQSVFCTFSKKSGSEYYFFVSDNFDYKNFMWKENILDMGILYPAQTHQVLSMGKLIECYGESGMSCHSDVSGDYKEKPFVHNRIREERKEKLNDINKNGN